MSNINYGFAALAHRHTILTSKIPPSIDDTRKFNLPSLILEKYGSECVDDPKMINLMKLNDSIHRDFLSGAAEAEAFKNKEYLRLHKSTLTKVGWFNQMLQRLLYGRIKTKGSNWKNRANNFLELPIVNILGLIAVLYSIFQLVISIFKIKVQL